MVAILTWKPVRMCVRLATPLQIHVFFESSSAEISRNGTAKAAKTLQCEKGRGTLQRSVPKSGDRTR